MDTNSITTKEEENNKEFDLNPKVLIIIAIIVILYYFLFASLGETIDLYDIDEKSFFTILMEFLLWSFFILLVLLNGMSYIFDMDISASISNLFSASPLINLEVNNNTNNDNNIDTNNSISISDIMKQKEVFHIPGNRYSYEDAKAICLSYDGRLATYQEISDAYDNGADWCGYGWSDGQMALFPTQQSKWQNLQSIDGHENDCGRPGINGGYIDNPNVRFGINCFGYKPDIKAEEVKQMENATLYQKTQKETDFDKKVDHWRSKIPEILIAPFNHENWSVV